jgi:hypothetical protein
MSTVKTLTMILLCMAFLLILTSHIKAVEAEEITLKTALAKATTLDHPPVYAIGKKDRVFFADHKIPSFQFRSKLMLDHNVTLSRFANGSYYDVDTGKLFPYNVTIQGGEWLESI